MWWLWLACSVPESTLVEESAQVRPPAPPVAEDEPPRPVVLVTLDTVRADRIGAWGHAEAETPNLDALAARGIRFSQAYAPVPLTIPSHSSLFTGLYPPHHGVRDNGDQRLSTEAWTLAESLNQAGYRTGASIGAFVTQAHWGFGQGFSDYRDDLGVPSDRLSWRAERPADEVIDDALELLEQGVDFLWVHLFDAHAPYSPPSPFSERHQDRPYDGEIAWLDHQLGRLVASLPQDVLLVVAGDHGEALGDEGEQQHGLLLSDATLHVPLVLVGSRLDAPQVVDEPVSLVDIAPTLWAELDMPVPSGLDGRDLLGPWRSDPVTDERRIYTETLYGAHHYGWTSLHGVLTDRGQLI
ncbi:MAG: sulfatase, partial [Myxococcota bacterium]|nr:sulfatase [Myxococcota bacterium]